MKHYTTLLCSLLVLSSVSAQQLAQKLTLGPAVTNVPERKAVVNESRNEQIAFLINYDGIDEIYASQVTSGAIVRYTWPLNKNFTADNSGTLRTAAVVFDSLMFSDVNTGLIGSYPKAGTQINLDSIDILYNYEKQTSTLDTLIISVIRGSSFSQTGTGINGALGGVVLWADTTYMDASYNTGDVLSELMRFPALSLPRGEWFAIKVDFAGDTANKFNILSSYRDDCSNECIAEPSAAGHHAYYYMNYNSNGTDMSGIGPFVVDCNQDGLSGTFGQCEQFYFQNHAFLAYVTADIELTAYFDNDTFAFCNGTTTLQSHVAGVEGPVTYSWSPSTGLSSDTVANPTVAVPANPILYTLTVTDSTSVSVATILVTTEQSSCEVIDTFSGRVYFDQNNNSQYDNGEYIMVNTAVRANNKTVLTDNTGRYTVGLPRSEGAYSISIPNTIFVYSYNVPSTGKYLGTLNGDHLDYDFAIRGTGDSSNLYIVMGSHGTPPRPGFNSIVTALCFNPVPEDIDVEFKMVYDSLQSYEDASPAPDNVNQITRTITWNTTFSALSQNVFSLQLYTPPTVPLNTVLRTRAYLTLGEPMVEVDTTDNYVVYEQIVVGSYDPNDKAVSPVGQGPDGRMLPGQNLQYTIRFQNTGTFYAENVAVRDTLDTDLDLSTFRMLSASHRYEYTFNGNVITWNFNQIMLLDSHTNEPESHGYISYAIAMKDDVIDLSPISNTAYIYFDFNEAIVTNTTLSTVDYNLNVGIADVSAGTSVKVYPNPFKGETNFVLGSECKGASLKVYNLTGQLVDQRDNLAEGVYTYSAKKLATGMYNYLIVNSVGIVAKGKLVAE